MAQPLILNRRDTFASNLEVLFGIVELELYCVKGQVPDNGRETAIQSHIYRQLSIALHQTRESYKSIEHMHIVEIDGISRCALDDLFEFVNKVRSETSKGNLDRLNDDISEFFAKLPRNEKLPYITAVEPQFLELSAAKTVQIVIKGNFPGANRNDFIPSLRTSHIVPGAGPMSVECKLVHKALDALTFEVSRKIFQAIKHENYPTYALEEPLKGSYLYKRLSLDIVYVVPGLVWSERKTATFTVCVIAKTPES